MKTLLAISLLAVIGCAGSKVKEVSAISRPLGSYSVVHVEVSSPSGDAGEFLPKFSSTLIARLRELEMFKTCTTNPEPGEADLRISAVLTAVNKVSSGERAAGGAFAGAAKIDAVVTVKDLKTGEDLGQFSVMGKSSSAWIAFQGTATAVRKSAEGVAGYLADHK